VSVDTESSGRYTAVAVVLHWAMALGILTLAAIGFVMVHLSLPLQRKFELYQLHKSIGVTILLAAFLRLGWRLMNKPPELPAHMPSLARAAAVGGHRILYFLLFALPLTGWALVSVSVLSIPTVLYGVIPWPHLPVLPTLTDKPPVEAFLKHVHACAAWALIASVAGHAGAALSHHLIKHDDVLLRMLPRFARRSLSTGQRVTRGQRPTS
jgi:cytochrome b561